jgi:mRNA interferase YafQ
MGHNQRLLGKFRPKYAALALTNFVERGLKEVVNILSETGTLPIRYKPHKLSGRFKGAWECHIEPDWLLIWQQNNTELVLLLIDTGTHSDIFR